MIWHHIIMIVKRSTHEIRSRSLKKLLPKVFLISFQNLKAVSMIEKIVHLIVYTKIKTAEAL